MMYPHRTPKGRAEEADCVSIFSRTADMITGLARRHDSALIAFSGGKDSLVVMDLARRHFKRVAGLFMYFVPGLQCDADRLKIAEAWGVPVIQYPHFGFLECIKHGVYAWERHKEFPQLTRQQIYDLARRDCDCKCVLTGIRKSDSMARRNPKRMTSADVYHPIFEWKDFDVFAYCELNQIPLPATPSGQRSSGVDLKGKTLLWLHENYPDDFDRICDWFPFARAVLYRERWFYGYQGGADETPIIHDGESPPQPDQECALQPATDYGQGA